MKWLALLPLFISFFAIDKSLAQAAVPAGHSSNNSSSNSRSSGGSSYSASYGSNSNAGHGSVHAGTSAHPANNGYQSKPTQTNSTASYTSANFNNRAGYYRYYYDNVGNYAATGNAGAMMNYNSMSRASAPTSRGKRYNFEARFSYPYYSSLVTKAKSLGRHSCHDNIHSRCRHARPSLTEAFCDVPFYPIFYCYDFFYDDLIFNSQPSGKSNAANFVSLDGYLIYDKDTLSGIVTLEKNAVFLEQPVNEKREYGYSVNYSDEYLKGIVLFKGDRELYLARLSASDKQLWRVLHTGKLNLYDDRYSFLYIGNINKANLRISYIGETSSQVIKDKAQLIECVNKAYGLNLMDKDYTWKQLFNYIDNLD